MIDSVAIGHKATINGQGSIAIGVNAIAKSVSSVVIGENAQALDCDIVIGSDAYADKKAMMLLFLVIQQRLQKAPKGQLLLVLMQMHQLEIVLP